MYEYAATMIAPRYLEFSACATTIEVGPSAAPITATEAASFISKNIDEVQRVKKMPNCAAAPKSMSFGFESSGPKSIIAPMPMNRISGNSSFAMPASNSVSSGPRWVIPPITVSRAASAFGIFTSIVPKPSGRRSVGSISFFIARKMRSAPIRIITPCCHVNSSRFSYIILINAPFKKETDFHRRHSAFFVSPVRKT